MRGFLVRWLVSALSLWLASAIVPGMHIEGLGSLVLAALLLGIVNAVFRPLVILLTFPFTILTLGLFLFVINAAMLGFVAWLLPGFTLASFWSALLGSLVVSIVGTVLSWMIGPHGKYEALPVRRKY
jgi:putative membrane protein